MLLQPLWTHESVPASPVPNHHLLVFKLYVTALFTVQLLLIRPRAGAARDIRASNKRSPAERGAVPPHFLHHGTGLPGPRLQTNWQADRRINWIARVMCSLVWSVREREEGKRESAPGLAKTACV